MSVSAGSLDTNVLLRLILRDVPDQHAAAVRLIKGSPGQLSIADMAIVEVAFVLGRNYGFSRMAIQETLDNVLALPLINANRGLFSRAFPMFVKNPGLSLEDCCFAAYAESNGATPLWTFDRKLARQAAAAKLVDL